MRVALVETASGPRTGSRTYAGRLKKLVASRHEVVSWAGPDEVGAGVDVVHILDAKSTLRTHSRIASGIPLVVDLHDAYWTGVPGYPAFDRPLRRALWRWQRPRYLALLERADSVVVHSGAMLAVVPGDCSVFVPIPAEGPEAPPIRSHHDGPGRILFAGRDCLRKGLPVLGAALRSLRSQGVSTELRVAGDDYRHLRAAGRWWLRGVDTRFDTELTASGMDSAYDWADVVAVPSYTEAFGLVAQEALLRGVPVVASRTGGLGELLEECGGGVLVPPGDAASLARSLRDILGDSSAWRVRAASAAKQLRRERSPERTLDALDEAYAAAMARRGSPS